MDNKIEEDILKVRLYHEFFRENKVLLQNNPLEYFRQLRIYVEHEFHKVVYFNSSNNGFKKSLYINGNGKPKWDKMTDEEVKEYLRSKRIIR